MSVATPPVPVPSPLVPADWPAGIVLLTDIRWDTYEALLTDIGERHLRLTFDRGRLEITALSFGHEGTSRWTGDLVVVLAEEFNQPYCNAGSTTFRRKNLDRGLEPDECFYFANESCVRGLKVIDLTRDPPPDLAIEVDVTSSSVNRMAIYAALGVPEVWRWRDGALQVFLLQVDGTYAAVASSPTFPAVPLAKLSEIIEQGNTEEHLSLKRAFRAWVRTLVSP
jgi:Uma2 family endonuclease